MNSSPSSSSEELYPGEDMPIDTADPATPTIIPSSALPIPSSELSPPSSQGRSGMSINANGKRTLETNGAAMDTSGAPSHSTNGAANLSPTVATNAQRQASGAQVDPSTGYTWTNEEDAPGYSWLNKKTQDDAGRAWEQIVDKNRSIASKLGQLIKKLPGVLTSLQILTAIHCWKNGVSDERSNPDGVSICILVRLYQMLEPESCSQP